MAKYISGKVKDLNVGISNYSEDRTSVTVIGNVGIGTLVPTDQVGSGNTAILAVGILTANRVYSTVYGEFTGSSVVADNIVGTSLSVSGISTLANVNVSGGIITATTGVVTYYGDGSNLTGTALTMMPLTYDPGISSTSQEATVNIITTWNRPIEAGSGTITIREGSASGTVVDQFVVGSSSSITFSGNQLTLNPADTLGFSTTLYVTYPAGSIKAVGGQHENSQVITDFSTGAQKFSLWGWGNDGTGGWGDNTNPSSGIQRYSSPTQLAGGTTEWLYQGTEEMQVVIKSDGTMWAWGGQGEGGGLGLNDNVQRSSPTQVGTDTTWAYTVGQYTGQMAQKTDGTLWAWGFNNVGQAGLNSKTNLSSPTQVGTETTWALGKNKFDTRAHSAAIKTDGTLWTWGYNTSGELGLNNTTNYSSPKQVGTETTWAHLNLMSGMMAATKTDGTLWSWGGNSSGELGHNNRTNYSSPKQVGTATDWDGSKMTCRSASTYGAIKNTNELWVMGYGGAGALGDNATVDRSSPTQIPGAWKQGCMQQIVSSCVKTDGTLWTWGRNQSGNLGTNNQQPGDGAQSSPVQVGTDTDWVNVQFNSQMTTASRST